MSFDRETFDRIQEAAAPNLTVLGGVTFSDKDLTAVEPPLPKPIIVRTLSSLCAFINSRPEGYMTDKIVHVEEPHIVRIIEPHIAGCNRTHELLTAVAERSNLKSVTDEWSSIEDFMVKLNTLFDSTMGDHYTVRNNLSSVTAESTLNLTDDGTSQSVALRSGIQRKEAGELPNPVLLAPFTTFPEISQPLQPFILRLRKEGAGGLLARLYPVETPGSRSMCCAAVKNYLSNEPWTNESVAVTII